MQSVPKLSLLMLLSSNLAHGNVYSTQHYVIKFVIDLWQVRMFFSGYSDFPINKTDRRDITEILLKVALNTTNLFTWWFFFLTKSTTYSTLISDEATGARGTELPSRFYTFCLHFFFLKVFIISSLFPLFIVFVSIYTYNRMATAYMPVLWIMKSIEPTYPSCCYHKIVRMYYVHDK